MPLRISGFLHVSESLGRGTFKTYGGVLHDRSVKDFHASTEFWFAICASVGIGGAGGREKATAFILATTCTLSAS